MSSLHVPQRPFWTCDTCANPWPCPARRQELMRDFNSMERGMIMADYFEWACRELPDGDVGAIHNRFLGWVKG